MTISGNTNANFADQKERGYFEYVFKKNYNFKLLLMIFANVFYGCGDCKATENGEKLLTILALLGDNKKNQLRIINEPNNTMDTATCLSLMKEIVPSYVYPRDDIDYYSITLLEVPLKLFIADLASLSNVFNHGFQLYDEYGQLLYDANNRAYDKTSATLITNRYLRQDECSLNKCQDLSTVRYIEFRPTIKKIFIKIYSLKQEKYSEGEQLNELIQLSSKLDPRDNPSYPNILIKANAIDCK